MIIISIYDRKIKVKLFQSKEFIAQNKKKKGFISLTKAMHCNIKNYCKIDKLDFLLVVIFTKPNLFYVC